MGPILHKNCLSSMSPMHEFESKEGKELATRPLCMQYICEFSVVC